jgi:hypothetical protein
MEDEDFAQFSQDVGSLSLKRRKVILSQSDSEMDVGADPGNNIANLSQPLNTIVSSLGIETEFTRLHEASEDLENDDVEFRPRSSGPADSEGSLKTFIDDSGEDKAISAPPFYAMLDNERAQLEREVRLWRIPPSSNRIPQIHQNKSYSRYQNAQVLESVFVLGRRNGGA